MVEEYPYILKPTSLEDFLKKMPDRPLPDAVSQAYLRSLGYTSSSDRPLIPILKFINFIDSSGAPTESFKKFRDTSRSKAVMGEALKEGYATLFKTHGKPCEASEQDLENFFRTATGRGGRMLSATVSTFKILCQFAEIGVAAPPTPPPTLPPTTPPTIQLPVTREGGVNVSVNISLELPATQDATVYDKIFESLKKHLLSPSSKTD